MIKPQKAMAGINKARQAATDPMAAMQPLLAQKRAQHVARLNEQGYVVREGGMLRSKIAYQAGQLTVNGLPFDPMAAMQPPQPVGQPMPLPHTRPRAPMPVAR